MDDLGARICEEARRWIGTPWVHQRYHKGLGCDCIGLVRGVALALNLCDASDGGRLAKPFLGYGMGAEPEKMKAALSAYLEPIAFSPLSGAEIIDLCEPGDVLWIAFKGIERHVGIFTAERHIIHSYQGVGKVVEHTLDAKWTRRVAGAYRFPRAV